MKSDQMTKDGLKKIVQGALELAWGQGGGNANGDLSAIRPILWHALSDVPAPTLRTLLQEIADG